MERSVFLGGVLHLFAFQRIFYANLVFKNCGDQEVKLGYRLLFVLKHLEIVTQKKKIKNVSFPVSFT